MRDTSAAILAGGRAVRMGGACKPLLEVQGRRILDRQLDVLRTLTSEVYLVANDPAPFASYDLRVVPDLRPGLGPLAGLEAALTAAGTEHVLLLAGDLPFLDPGALALLLRAPAESDAVVPFTAHGPEPLHARYARRLLPQVAAALDAGRLAPRQLYDEIRLFRVEEPALRAVDPALSFLANVNTPADLASARREG